MTYKERKSLCIEHYGGSCVDCKETNMDKLSLYFPNESGSEFKKNHGIGDNNSFTRWLIKNKFPDIDIIVLCNKCRYKRQGQRRRGKEQSEEVKQKLSNAQRKRRAKEDEERRRMWNERGGVEKWLNRNLRKEKG